MNTKTSDAILIEMRDKAGLHSNAASYEPQLVQKLASELLEARRRLHNGQQTRTLLRMQRLVSRSRELALSYFAAHPEAKADATAKGLVLMREDWRRSHRYEYRDGESRCWVCGESWHAKEMTRCTGFAAKYPRPDTSIEGTIRREEVLYDETVNRSRALVLARLTRPEEVTGEALAELYHTHGCDSSIVEEVLDCRLPESVHTEFMGLMDKERARSRAAQKKEIITVRTTGDVAATANDKMSH